MADPEQKYCPRCGVTVTDQATGCPRCGLEPGSSEEWELDVFVGKTVDGRYKVMGRLGRGNFGTIYRVVHVELGTARALKRPHAHLPQTSRSLERFRREATTLGLLEHPNIVRVEDFGFFPARRPYLVMEYLQGESLREILKREGRLDCRRAVQLAKQVANALLVAHGSGVLHRDLKPANMMVTQIPGHGEVLKVVDFGLARLAHTGGAITQVGMAAGTPDFMAPEQWDPVGPDERADIYSLGVTLYCCLTGELPFNDVLDRAQHSLEQQGKQRRQAQRQGRVAPHGLGTLGEVMRQIVERDYRDPCDVCPDGHIPAALDQLVRRLMAPDPQQRVQSADQALLELQQVEAEMEQPGAVSQGGATGGGQVKRTSHRAWGALGVAGLALATLAVVAVLVSGGRGPVDGDDATPGRRPEITKLRSGPVPGAHAAPKKRVLKVHTITVETGGIAASCRAARGDGGVREVPCRLQIPHGQRLSLEVMEGNKRLFADTWVVLERRKITLAPGSRAAAKRPRAGPTRTSTGKSRAHRLPRRTPRKAAAGTSKKRGTRADSDDSDEADVNW